MILVDVYRKHSKNIVGVIIALWVLLVNVSGNFTAETLGCKTQKLLNTMFALFVITFGIIGCFNMNARDREELFDMWMGMIAADVVDSLFDDD